LNPAGDSEAWYVALGRNLVAARQAAGLRQYRVAHRAALWPASLCRYESGELKLRVGPFLRLAAALGVAPSALIPPLP